MNKLDKMLNKAQWRYYANPDNFWNEMWFGVLLFVEYLKERRERDVNRTRI